MRMKKTGAHCVYGNQWGMRAALQHDMQWCCACVLFVAGAFDTIMSYYNHCSLAQLEALYGWAGENVRHPSMYSLQNSYNKPGTLSPCCDLNIIVFHQAARQKVGVPCSVHAAVPVVSASGVSVHVVEPLRVPVRLDHVVCRSTGIC